MIAQNSTLDTALAWIRSGRSVIPIPHGEKGPRLAGWPDLRITEPDAGTYFNGSGNIGLLLGEPSGGLIDIDLDCDEACRAAPHFFSRSFVYGRNARPGSHRLYICPEAKSKKFLHAGRCLLEIRSTGQQSLIPPSVHPSGDLYRAEAGAIKAQPISLADIEKAAQRTAAAALLALNWTDSRHEKALALAGALRHSGWDAEGIVTFAQAVVDAACDDEGRDRMRAVSDTLKANGATSGWPTLSKLIGEDVIKQVRDWLGIKDFPDIEIATDMPIPNAMKPISAGDLMAMDMPDPVFVIPDLLPQGTSLLVGRPKLGKSWWALHAAIATASGGMVMNWRRAHQGEVLYLSLEDNLRRLKKRLKKLLAGDAPPAGLSFQTEWPRVDQGGLDNLVEYLTAHPRTSLVIIDTLKKLRARDRRGSNMYDTDYESVEGLKRLSDQFNVAILLVHHTRKGVSDDPLEEISGSFGLSGAVDGVLILRRQRGSCDATLFVTGRDYEAEQDIALKWDEQTATWEALGIAEDYLISPERVAVIELLRARGAMNGKDITRELGREYPSTKVLLNRMSRDGQIHRESNKWCVELPVTSVTCNPGKVTEVTGVTKGTLPPEVTEVTGNSNNNKVGVCASCKHFEIVIEECRLERHIADPYQPIQCKEFEGIQIEGVEDQARQRLTEAAKELKYPISDLLFRFRDDLKAIAAMSQADVQRKVGGYISRRLG